MWVLWRYLVLAQGTVRVVFQPAEEGGQGAQMMLQEGLLEKEPRALMALGLHVAPELPTGILASREGPLMAATGRSEYVCLPARFDAVLSPTWPGCASFLCICLSPSFRFVSVSISAS